MLTTEACQGYIKTAHMSISMALDLVSYRILIVQPHKDLSVGRLGIVNQSKCYTANRKIL